MFEQYPMTSGNQIPYDPTLPMGNTGGCGIGTASAGSTGWAGNYGYQAFSFMQVGDKLYRMNPYTGQCWMLAYDTWKLIQESI